jgi:hypothetical protein
MIDVKDTQQLKVVAALFRGINKPASYTYEIVEDEWGFPTSEFRIVVYDDSDLKNRRVKHIVYVHKMAHLRFLLAGLHNVEVFGGYYSL